MISSKYVNWILIPKLNSIILLGMDWVALSLFRGPPPREWVALSLFWIICKIYSEKVFVTAFSYLKQSMILLQSLNGWKTKVEELRGNIESKMRHWLRVCLSIILMRSCGMTGWEPCLRLFLSLQMEWIATWKQYRNRKSCSMGWDRSARSPRISCQW